LYRRADKFLLWGDLVSSMLGCEPVTSFSLANRTLLFDIRKEDWSPVLLEAAGFDRSKLPGCVASGTVAGEIPEKIASDLGLTKGVKVVVGGHDQSCNALGAGIASAGKAVCGIGTFECITPVYDHIPDPLTMVNSGLNVEHHILPGLYVSFIYNQAGSLVRWFRDTFAASDKRLIGESADIYDVLAAEMPDAPTQLFALPYFEPTGAPEFVADASGAIFGLKTGTTRGEILKAIMEGVTFYFVESIEKLKGMKVDTSEFVASGGGAKSDKWLQIKADILGVPFVQLSIPESGTVGCAILAGTATGVFKTPDEGISLLVKHGTRFEPNSARNKIYRDKYAAYKSLVRRHVRATA
jgi:xylulokinase